LCSFADRREAGSHAARFAQGAGRPRLPAKAPFGRWRTLTFLAALRCDGLTAPCVIDGPINGVSFRAYVEQVFLPAYSPDLNPIEQAFAKMKSLLRKADARTIGETWRTVGALLDCFTPKECANYFRNAGYASA
jgi:hypothetical protein